MNFMVKHRIESMYGEYHSMFEKEWSALNKMDKVEPLRERSPTRYVSKKMVPPGKRRYFFSIAGKHYCA
jgi:hypothetical protein